MRSRIANLGPLSLREPRYGDFKLNVFPFEWDIGWVDMPRGFDIWEHALDKIMRRVPLQAGANRHYVTIDSKFFTQDGLLRREGVHIDGNFCVDPTFGHATWSDGGTTTDTWSGGKFDAKTGKAVMSWASPYDIEMPIGQYVSKDKGGIFCVSTDIGCQAWQGDFNNEVIIDGGNCEGMRGEFTDDKKVVFEANTLYFMTSNTPHETLMTPKGRRRTFLRVTLNHNYRNEEIFGGMAQQHNQMEGSSPYRAPGDASEALLHRAERPVKLSGRDCQRD